MHQKQKSNKNKALSAEGALKIHEINMGEFRVYRTDLIMADRDCKLVRKTSGWCCFTPWPISWRQEFTEEALMKRGTLLGCLKTMYTVIICIDYIQLHSLVRIYIIVTSAYAQSHLQKKFHTDLVNLIKRYSLSMIITEN